MSITADDLYAAMQETAERAVYAKQIRKENTPQKWRALREFYRLALPSIEQAPSWRWGIDPYEVDWGSVFTPIENALWFDIRSTGAVLYPQFPVGRFFVDFANPVARVAVECDGAAFHTDKERDAARDGELMRAGWSVYRITGRDCMSVATEEENLDTGRITLTPSAAEELMLDLIVGHGIGRGGVQE